MKIVSLLPSATEILFALGLGEQALAVSHECDYPAEAAKLPRVTRSVIDSSQPSLAIDDQVQELMRSGSPLYELNASAIRELQPELIITQAQCDVCAIRYEDVVQLVRSSTGLCDTKVLALNPRSLRQVYEDVLQIGEAAGCLPRAVEYKDGLLLRQSRVMQAVGGALPPAERPRVVVIEWIEPLMAAGNWTPEIVETAGGNSVLAKQGQASEYVSWPDVVAALPEVLIVSPCGFDLERSLIEARQLLDLPGFRDLPAVAGRRVFVVDGNAYVNRSGPRIVDSLEIFAHLIHPEVIPAPTGELAAGRAWARLE
jgi:iron complex transport system substrate-binding protein